MRRNYFNRAITLFLMSFVLVLSACTSGQYQNTMNGALAGAAAGAGTGAVISSTGPGKAGPGIAIGAGIGAITGALAGSMVDRQASANRQLEAHIGENERKIQENKLLIEQLKAKGADVRGTDRGVVVNLPDILFEFDRAQLTAPAVRTVSEISSVLRDVQDRPMAVEGHTDSIGSVLYNKQLSSRRAEAVAAELGKQGIDRGKLKVRGLGEGYPVATNNSDIGRTRNRRVEIIVENR